MIIAAVLAITLDPAMRLLFTHMKNFEFRPRWLARIANAVLVGKIHSEENHPISRILIRVYHPVAAWSLRWKWVVIAAAVALVVVTVPVFGRLGSEFMPPLDEGALLYMPTTVPGISITEAERLLQVQDRILARFPGSRAGARQSRPRRNLHRPRAAFDGGDHHHAQARRRVAQTPQPGTPAWAPAWIKPLFRHITPDHISQEELVDEMNQASAHPRHLQCLDHAHQKPRGHADHRHPHARGRQSVRRGHADHRAGGPPIETLLAPVPGTRSVFAERTGGGYFLDVGLEPRQTGPLRLEHR